MPRYLETFKIKSMARRVAPQHDRLSPGPERYHGGGALSFVEGILSWIAVIGAALILVAVLVATLGR